ncbi:MAG: NYN domain-containing protein [Candidatus Parcubacteria bacterium]|nr:NYN domain-containing protein [Candidatus Parcubacteria bacterium]
MEEKPKIKVYIDGANMFYTQKKLEWSFDWGKIKNYIEADKEVIEWKYYVGIKDDDKKMQKYLKYLNSVGFNTFTKPLKKIKTNDTNHIYKANFDVEITVDILLDKSKIDEIIIFSGDSDFQYLIKKLKDAGKKVNIYSSRKTISWELKLGASNIFYLEDIKNQIKRK